VSQALIDRFRAIPIVLQNIVLSYLL